MRILRSPKSSRMSAKRILEVYYFLPLKGVWSAGVTLIFSCMPCSLRTTTSMGESHHPRRLACFRLFHAVSKSSSETLDA